MGRTQLAPWHSRYRNSMRTGTQLNCPSFHSFNGRQEPVSAGGEAVAIAGSSTDPPPAAQIAPLTRRQLTSTPITVAACIARVPCIYPQITLKLGAHTIQAYRVPGCTLPACCAVLWRLGSPDTYYILRKLFSISALIIKSAETLGQPSPTGTLTLAELSDRMASRARTPPPAVNSTAAATSEARAATSCMARSSKAAVSAPPGVMMVASALIRPAVLRENPTSSA